MPVKSSEACSMFACANGSTAWLNVGPHTRSPDSFISIGVAATSSSASVRALKPPVSTSSTTGR